MHYLCIRLATDVADVSLQVLGVRVLGDVLPQTLQISTSTLSTLLESKLSAVVFIA